MRFFHRKRVFALIVLSFYLLSPVASWACTSMMVGKNASTTGRPLFARTEDSQPNGSKKFIVVPAGFYKADTEYQLDAQGFRFTFSHDSYKYTAVPDTTRLGISALGGEAASKDAVPHWEDGFHFTFDGAGVNEKGFAVSATTTTGFRGLMPTGTAQWTERTMAKVLLAEAANCREAMDVIDRILAPGPGQQGMANEIIHMADQNEAWMLEAVSRYHYVASRVPDDSFAVIANAMQHQFFDENDPENFRSNFKPNTYAEENGFARYQFDENGVKRVNISLTYGAFAANAGVNGEANSYRRWRGMTMFTPSLGSNIKVLDRADFLGGGGTDTTSSDIGLTYPTYIKPDRKISPMDIAWMQRDRYAGTPFDQTYSPQYLNANGGETREGTSYTAVSALPAGSTIPAQTPTGATAIRTIGYFTQQHTHIFDVGGNLPPEIGARFWIGMAASETSVNLPFYGNITDTHPRHKFNITAANTETTGNGVNTIPPYDPNSGYSIFSRTGFLARGDRKNYVAPIQAFWRAYELKLYEDQEKVIEPELLRLYNESPEDAAKFITDYTIEVADRAFRAAEKIHDSLVAHIATAPNTLFAIPAELIEPTINETALRTPTDDDKKAVEGAMGIGHSLLTRDDGNVQVNSVSAGDAPDVDGYMFNQPGNAVNIALKPEQAAAKQTAAKMLYEVKLDDSESLDNLKKNLAFVMSVGGETLKLVGPDSDALLSFSDALAIGIAALTLTSDGVIVALEYILVDGPGNSGIYNNRLVVCDGVPDDALNGSIWIGLAASSDPDKDNDNDNGSSGCDAAGFVYAAAGLFAILMYIRKRSK